jgi:hypothetical protein
LFPREAPPIYFRKLRAEPIEMKQRETYSFEELKNRAWAGGKF